MPSKRLRLAGDIDGILAPKQRLTTDEQDIDILLLNQVYSIEKSSDDRVKNHLVKKDAISQFETREPIQ